MPSDVTVAGLQTLRRRSGLTQKELAGILGFRFRAPVSRHERSNTVPNFLTVLAYEVIFRVPSSDLFPGMYQAVDAGIEQRLAALEAELMQSTAKGRQAVLIARKLEFLWERKNLNSKHAFE